MFHNTQSSTSGIEFAVSFTSEDSYDSHTTDYLSSGSSSGELFSSSQESLEHVDVSTFPQSDDSSHAPFSFVQASSSCSDTGTSAHLENGSVSPDLKEQDPPKTAKKGRRYKQPAPKRIRYDHSKPKYVMVGDASSLSTFISAYLENGSISPDLEEQGPSKKVKMGRDASSLVTGTCAHLEDGSDLLDLKEQDPPKTTKNGRRCKQPAPKKIRFDHSKPKYFMVGDASSISTFISAHLENGSVLPDLEEQGPPKMGRRCMQPAPPKRTTRNILPANHSECKEYVLARDVTGTSAHLENGSILPDLAEQGPPKRAKMGRRCKEPVPPKRTTRNSLPTNSYNHSEHVESVQAKDVSSSYTSAHLENDSVVLDLGECDPPIKKFKNKGRRKQVARNYSKIIRASPTGNHSNQPQTQESSLLNCKDDSRSEQFNGESFEHSGVSTSSQSDEPCSFYSQDSFSPVQAIDSSNSDSGTYIYFDDDSILLDLECTPPRKKTESREETTPIDNKTLRVSPTRRSNHPRHAVNILKTWLAKNIGIPYPTEDQKTDLANQTGLAFKQVLDWFTNERRRNLEKYGGDRAACKLYRKASNRNKKKNLQENKENQNPDLASGSGSNSGPFRQNDPCIASGSGSNHVPFVENDPCIASGSGLNPVPFMENSSGSLLVSSLEQKETKIIKTEKNQSTLSIFSTIISVCVEWDKLPKKPEMPKAEWIKKEVIMEYRAQ